MLYMRSMLSDLTELVIADSKLVTYLTYHVRIKLYETQVVVSSLLSCPLIEDHPYDVYLYQLPIFSLLIINTVFLVVVMTAVVTKLQSSCAGEVERLHYKSARALVIVIPLLGFTYILTLVGPSYSLHPLAHQIFQTFRSD